MGSANKALSRPKIGRRQLAVHGRPKEMARMNIDAARAPALEKADEKLDLVAPVSREELKGRLASIRAEMRLHDLDVALFTTPESIYYLSGYQTRAITSTQALAVTAGGEIVLMTRRIDEGNFLAIKDRSPISRFVAFSDNEKKTSSQIIGSVVRDLLGSAKTLGAEPAGIFMSPLEFDRLRETLGQVEIRNIGDAVDRMRLQKSPWEISCHRAAAAIMVAAMRRGLEAVRLGVLDSDIAAEVASANIRSGSEWVATWPIILTGRQTGRPHSSWQREAVKPGEPTTLEFAAVQRRYHSPLLRTVIISPTAEQTRLAEAVSIAHRAGVKALRPGARAEDIYFAEREVLGEFGAHDLLSGKVGYSIGVSFAPNWLQRGGIDLVDGNQRELRSGMVFNLVTMVTRANEFGIAHSSTVVVTEDGAETLTDDGLSGPLLL